MPQFNFKPITVEARQFSMQDTSAQEALASWCNGRLRGMRLDDPEERIIQIDINGEEREAQFLDWIIELPWGDFMILTQRQFTLFLV